MIVIKMEEEGEIRSLWNIEKYSDLLRTVDQWCDNLYSKEETDQKQQQRWCSVIYALTI